MDVPIVEEVFVERHTHGVRRLVSGLVEAPTGKGINALKVGYAFLAVGLASERQQIEEKDVDRIPSVFVLPQVGKSFGCFSSPTGHTLGNATSGKAGR